MPDTAHGDHFLNKNAQFLCVTTMFFALDVAKHDSAAFY